LAECSEARVAEASGLSESRGIARSYTFQFGSRAQLCLLLTTLYVIAVLVDSRRFVWFDELFTLDIARSPSLHDLWLRMLRFDNNPPVVVLKKPL
jgi:hypothetical protein